MTNRAIWASLALNLGWAAASPANAACTIPNSIANGQVADASKIMDNFSAVASCADAKSAAGAANSVQINTGSGVLGGVGPLSTGQVLAGSTGGAPQAATIVAGTGISIINSPGSITVSRLSGDSTTSTDIVMALGAAWAKEMIVNGPAINAGTSRSVKADLGAYVGMRMIANTNGDISGRAISTVNYTVPTGAVAFVVYAQAHDNEISNGGFYRARLYNVTQSRVAAGSSDDSDRSTPSQLPGVAGWRIQYSGLLSTNVGGPASGVTADYPIAGVAGDVLQLEAWTNGDGNYRMQDIAVYLVVVNATTGDPIS